MREGAAVRPAAFTVRIRAVGGPVGAAGVSAGAAETIRRIVASGIRAVVPVAASGTAEPAAGPTTGASAAGGSARRATPGASPWRP